MASNKTIEIFIQVSASSSDTARQSRTYTNIRGRSSSPNRMRQNQAKEFSTNNNNTTTVTTTTANPDANTTAATTTTTTTQHHTLSHIIPVQRNLENEEPIRLSKYSGGYAPDPQTPHKIEGLDWPAPPYPAAVPELRTRSRSSSNRRAPSTVHSVNGDDSSDDEDTDVNDQEVKRVLIDGVEIIADNGSVNVSGGVGGGGSRSGASSSALARAKASRPNSKLRYHQNKLFDNDYDDYLLRYKSDKEWRKIMQQSLREGRLLSGESDVEKQQQQQVVNEEDEEKDEEEDRSDSPPPPINAKLQREIDEISKIENESSMAAALLTDLKAHQQVISRKLKIDPWKASRTPSANVEPTMRTRYESPINACKLKNIFLIYVIKAPIFA
jgi:hypothetical protein